MKNECGYTKDWLPYNGYDKFEYDIKLWDGSMIMNCYPNGGKFHHPNSDSKFHENLVEEIRLSNNPVMGVNDDLLIET